MKPKSIVLWTAVALLGGASTAVLALAKGEQVNALWMVVASVCVFAISYRFHSAWLMANVLTLNDARITPAVQHEDGKDYVPTNKWVVFGHHFAAIAGPGPLVGPVLAAQFGFLPGMLWILVGATLGGAVHDCIILFCSIRRRGKSLGQMIREEVGEFAGIIALMSIVVIMVILLAVLALVVVKALAESPWGLFTILCTIPISMALGVGLRFRSGHVGILSGLAVGALLLSVVGGHWIQGTALEALLTRSGTELAWGIMAYGFLASVLPVWLLLAPRDYLSTFMKVGTVALLAVAIIVIAPPLRMEGITKFIDGTGPVFAGPVFPFCFITIACSAVSGFHSLISSGTTPKLLGRESDIRIVGYGAMITEMLVGIMALIAACAMQPGEYFAVNMKGAPSEVVAKVTAMGYPVTEARMAELAAEVGEKTMIGRTGGAPTFAVGMAHMFSKVTNSPTALAIWYHFAIMFEALFILTTIDAGTRVGRFIVQDLLSYLWKPLGRTDSTAGNWAASALFVAAWGWFLYQGVIDPLGGVNSLWPIFGVANQLLAVVALTLGVTVFLKMGKIRYLWVPLAPLAFLLVVTISAGWMKIFSADPRLGFISAASKFRSQIAGAGDAVQIAQWQHQVLNNQINAVVTGLLLLLVISIVLVSAAQWLRILSKREIPVLHEEPTAALG